MEVDISTKELMRKHERLAREVMISKLRIRLSGGGLCYHSSTLISSFHALNLYLWTTDTDLAIDLSSWFCYGNLGRLSNYHYRPFF